MSHDHPITDEDVRNALVSIAATAGGRWRGTPVSFADRLVHHFDLTHQPVTVADLATILVLLRSLIALAGDAPFSVFDGTAAISIETQEIDGRQTDLVVITLVSTTEEAAP